jgi:hypothetical protein
MQESFMKKTILIFLISAGFAILTLNYTYAGGINVTTKQHNHAITSMDESVGVAPGPGMGGGEQGGLAAGSNGLGAGGGGGGGSIHLCNAKNKKKY